MGVLLINKIDDGIDVCLLDVYCFEMDNLKINDCELGQVDYFVLDLMGMIYDDLKYVVMKVYVDKGDNVWVLICLVVIVDGNLMYCNDELDFLMGSLSSEGEFMEWMDDNLYCKICGSCYFLMLIYGFMVGKIIGDSVILWFCMLVFFLVMICVSLQSNFSDFIFVGFKYIIMDDDFIGILVLLGLKFDICYFYEVLVDGVVVFKLEFLFCMVFMGLSLFWVVFGFCVKYVQ